MSEQTTAPTERDELATLITRTRHVRALHLELPASIINHVTGGIAESVLEAGYRKPRTVTTAEELDALPKLSVIRASNGYVLEKLADGWTRAGVDYPYVSNPFWLPATVLHEGVSA